MEMARRAPQATKMAARWLGEMHDLVRRAELEREREVPTASDIRRLGELTVTC